MLKKLRNKFIWITMCIVTALLVMIFTLQYQMTVMNLDQRADGFLRALSNSAEKPSGIFEEQDNSMLEKYQHGLSTRKERTGNCKY